MSQINESVIFDLDGTLVDSSNFEDECYVGAIHQVLGDLLVDSNWSNYPHVTDAGIVSEIVSHIRVANPTDVIAEVRNEFGNRVSEYLIDGGICKAIPGAQQFLKRLLQQGYRVGIATGGWRHTAEMKLAHARVNIEGIELVSCDAAIDRTGIMTHCLRKIGGDPNMAVYFGDAPWDIKAAESLGWKFVGVGERLSGQCANWMTNYLDPDWTLSSNQSLWQILKAQDH